MFGGGGEPAQTSMTTGMMAGRRRVRSLMNLPEGAAGVAADGLEVGGALVGRLRERRPDGGLRLLEQLLGLGRVDPAAGDDLGAGDQLAGGRSRR